MNEFVTVLTCTYPHEAAIAKGRLESEGIECLLKDELTVQVNNFYSNAVGGVKLQVREHDVTQALDILGEGGFLKEEVRKTPEWVRWFDLTSARLPFLGKKPYEVRLISCLALLVSLLVLFVYLANQPSLEEQITGNSWCLNQVDYQGKAFVPETVDTGRVTARIEAAWLCEEAILFKSNGAVRLPGFQSPGTWARWELDGRGLRISEADCFGYVYNGLYEVELAGCRLELASEQTTMFCEAEGSLFK